MVGTFGLDAVPNDRVTFGASYSYEHYNALNRSRQANPGAEFIDPQETGLPKAPTACTP